MFVCDNCKIEVEEDDDFCPNCGTLFSENSCETHKQVDAEGVCLICGKVCCSKCGSPVNHKYLCNEHSDIEIYQLMCRVYGSSDSLQVDFLISMLEKNEFHPLKFNRKTSPISLGVGDYSLFRASGEFSGHLINEIKILVALSEYLEATKIIEEILDDESIN